MKEIQLTDAKAMLSRMLDDALAGEPQIITRRGKREAVIISYIEFERLSRVPKFGWLPANSPLERGDIAKRKPARVSGRDRF